MQMVGIFIIAHDTLLMAFITGLIGVFCLLTFPHSTLPVLVILTAAKFLYG